MYSIIDAKDHQEGIMGFRARWLAVKGGDLQEALRVLGLKVEAESNEAVYDPGLYAVRLPAGWILVIGDGWDNMDLVKQAHAQTLSAKGEALHLYTDDTPMCASLVGYRDGAELWSVEHDGSEGKGAPVVNGAAPQIVTDVVARLEKKQRDSKRADVDYLYDAAAEIGRELTGFRHDQTLGDGEVLPIMVLAKR